MVIISLLLIIFVLKVGLGQELLANEKCNEYPDRGTCDDRGFQVKWYYDRFSHRCREFFYGGCGGNNNRFDTSQECMNECRFDPDGMEAEKRCNLPHDPGTCNGDFQRWIFDPQQKKCVCSWWSGCGGNANRFYSFEHCMSICGKFAVSQTPDAPPETVGRVSHRSQVSQNAAGEHLFFQAAPIETLPGGYRNLFISGSGNTDNAYRAHRILISGVPPIVYTRILPNLALHLRSGSQTTRNRTLSTKEIFRLQQLQKKSQRGNDEISQEKQDTAKQQQISTSTDTEPYQQPVLSAEQRAHLEARKRKHYEQEQARIREENYQRQLQAMRDQQEALNLQRYNQLYPRNRDHRLHGDQRQSADVPSRTKEASRGNAQAASHNHSQNHIAHTQTQYNGHETEHPEVRTNQFDSEALRRAHAEAEAHRASAGDSVHRSEAEDQTRRVHTGADDRRAQEIAEARRAEEEARIKQASQEQIPQTNVDTRSYDAWQMEYYRQLQEHRRQYAEQIRQRQLRERERELRYREELLRNRYNLDAARALAMQRRQQQLLASASEADNRLQTLNTVQQRTSLQQPSEDKTGYGDQQRNLQIDNTARSWFEDGNGRAYLRQRMNVNLLELPPTTVPPVETTTERRSDAEVRRAQAKARKRARFEKLKKLERMGLLPLRTTSARKPMTTAPPSPFVQTLDEELRPTVIRPSLYRSWPNSADSRSKSLLSQGKPRSREEILTREDIRSNIPVQLPEASSSTRGLDSVKQATELRNEVVKTADRIFEGDEIVRSEVINAEEKNEPFNNGKQIISLDDYDDEEWIEEDYDVDEYGRRLPEEDETAILDRWPSWREDTLLTSPDAQAERFVDENSSVSLMAVHPSRISKYMVSSTHEKPPFEVFPTAVSKTWEESTTPAYRGAELTPSFPLPVTHFRKGSITSSLSSTANPPVSPTETEASSKATLISGTADFELTYPRRTYTSATTATKEPPKASDTRTSPVVLDRATAVVGLKEHGRKTEGVHADVEDEQVDEDDYDTEDLFFWKPEYENNRLQKSVRDDETDGDEKNGERENAFRIKIHNKEVLAR